VTAEDIRALASAAERAGQGRLAACLYTAAAAELLSMEGELAEHLRPFLALLSLVSAVADGRVDLGWAASEPGRDRR
jgi:hypothetical protein